MPARRTEAGFTLIEITIVLVIMGLIAGLVLTRGPLRSSRLELEASVRTVTNALRLARGRAIADDRIVVVKTSVNGVAIDGGPTWRLSKGQSISQASIFFTPEGESSGGVIELASGDRHVAVAVEWLTGRVTVASAAP